MEVSYILDCSDQFVLSSTIFTKVEIDLTQLWFLNLKKVEFIADIGFLILIMCISCLFFISRKIVRNCSRLHFLKVN